MKVHISLSLLFIGILGAIQVSCSTPVKKEEKKAEVVQENKLPNMKLVKLDGKEFNAKTLLGSKTILILFQPDCDHCQNEAKQIAERLPAFASYVVYFVSSAPLKDIEKFSQEYKLSGKPNIHFATAGFQSIVDNYGPIPAPSIYIYSSTGSIENSFNGEMEIDVVIKYL